MSNVNLFTYIEQLRTKSTTYEYDPKLAPPYLLTLGLSNCNSDLKTVNALNQFLFTLPASIVYSYFMLSIPKGKRFIKWPKKEKKEKTKEIEELMEKYNISKREAEILLIDS